MINTLQENVFIRTVATHNGFSDNQTQCNSTWDFAQYYGSFLTGLSSMLNALLLRSLRLLLSLDRVMKMLHLRNILLHRLYVVVPFAPKWFSFPSRYIILCGPGSAVSIATGYGLDGPGIESRWGRHFCTCPDRPWGPPSLLYNGYRVFSGVKSDRGVTLTPYPLLVPWSWKGRAIPLLPLWAVRPVQSLSVCTKVLFTFTLCFTANNVSVACKQRSCNYYKIPLRVGRSYTPHTEKRLDDDGDSNEPECKF